MTKRREASSVKRLLTLLGLLAFCLAAALPLFAIETPRSAMRQASRLDAWRVVMLPDAIELRDYQNRLISRTALQRELRAGSREVAREAAGLSSMPGLKALLDYLDRSDLSASGLRDEIPRGRRGDEISALTPPRAPKLRPPAARVAARAPDGPAASVLSPLQFTLTPGRVRVLVLRL